MKDKATWCKKFEKKNSDLFEELRQTLLVRFNDNFDHIPDFPKGIYNSHTAESPTFFDLKRLITRSCYNVYKYSKLADVLNSSEEQKKALKTIQRFISNYPDYSRDISKNAFQILGSSNLPIQKNTHEIMLRTVQAYIDSLKNFTTHKSQEGCLLFTPPHKYDVSKRAVDCLLVELNILFRRHLDPSPGVLEYGKPIANKSLKNRNKFFARFINATLSGQNYTPQKVRNRFKELSRKDQTVEYIGW